jgi:hypothetical protein
MALPMLTRLRHVTVRLALFSIGTMMALPVLVHPASAAPTEPIAYMGHGAMFDQSGRELVRTEKFVLEAQQWYIRDLSPRLSQENRSEFLALQREIDQRKPQGHDRLAVNALLLQWLVDRIEVEGRLLGKLRALNDGLLERRIDAEGPYEFPASLRELLQRRKLLSPQQSGSAVHTRMLVTSVSGAAYRQLCSDHGVPLPPDFGPSSPWVSRGIINGEDLFIARKFNAEVLTYTSSAPPGLCVALPRFLPLGIYNTVILDGIICLGQSDPLSGPPKVCFWDNEVPSAPIGTTSATFHFERGTSQSISQWVGGSDLRAGVGGVCSDCHSGENPYIIHGPVLSALQGATGGLTFSSPVRWYEPIVRTGDTTPWPENPGPMNSPPTCHGCHGVATAAGYAGRLPHLSTSLPAYCNQVFRAALGAAVPLPSSLSAALNPSYPPAAMPPSAPGSLSCTPNRTSTSDPLRVPCNTTHTMACNAPGIGTMSPDARRCTPELASLLSWCGMADAGDAASRGDPHVVTFNGTPYDFQPAGEFVMLRNAAGFEVQVRQTPVSTAAPVGPDAHTGLTSCVSVHTAVAARLGGSKVTFQPGYGDNKDRGLEVRIDGKSVLLGRNPIIVGGGRVMRNALGDGLEVDFPDGAKLIAVPGFWGPPNNIWYLNIDVFNAEAGEGYAGAILAGQWLPLLSDMTGLGARPPSLSQRFDDLNGRFADAWRVGPADSLFDYAPGTGPADFVVKDWPPAKPPCIVPGSTTPPPPPMDRRKAQEICSQIKDKTLRMQCTLDVTATGDIGFFRTYQLSERLRSMIAPAP